MNNQSSIKQIVMNKLNSTWLFISAAIVLAGCGADDTVSDVESMAALKNVTISYDSASYQLSLPEGALTSGKTFEQLKAEDSAKFCNLANYSITLVQNLQADNKKTDSEDAKFDGLTLITVMDTFNSSSINSVADGFVVKKNSSIPVVVNGTINLQTHKKAGIYIFQKIVAGDVLKTTQTPVLSYKVGIYEGELKLVSIPVNIPTRASDETKAFLKGLLDSGILEQQVNSSK
jgi:hypothetical protein